MNKLAMEITKCLERGGPTEELVRLVAKATLTADVSDFRNVLTAINDEDLAPLAMIALPGWGKVGIDQLIEEAFSERTKLKTRTRALEVALWVSQGISPNSEHILHIPKLWDQCKRYAISPDIGRYCLAKLRDRLLIALNNEEETSSLLLLLGTKATMSFARGPAARGDLEYLLSIIMDSRLILNSAILAKFEDMLNEGPRVEEDLQKFLTQHPVLLDPFVTELFSKQQFGSDFITDYAVRRANDQYVLIEIENSTDKLFGQKGSFSPSLTEAIGQVRDFQAWISDNLSYAQKKLPRIKHPEGLVIIGRSSLLSDMEKKRLVEENHSRRGHIKIVTFDELLDTAKNVHRNMVEKPPVRSSKDTKSI